MKSILGSERKDWAYIILPFISGFLMLGIYLFLINILKLAAFPSILILIIIYSVLFDVNHYFSTYYRVFLDKSYYRENKTWIIPSLTFITVIPMLAFWAVSSDYFWKDSFLFFTFFRRFVLVLGFYHLVKQNWGFMAIYKRNAGEKITKINWDQLSLLSGSFIPLVLINMIDPLWFPDSEKYLFAPEANDLQYILNYWDKLAYLCLFFAMFFGLITIFSKRFQYKLPARNMAFYCLGAGILILSILKYSAKDVLTVILGLLTAIFTISLIQSVRCQLKEKSFNFPKWAVFATTLILYFGILLYPVEGDKSIMVVAITLPHNIQYLAFVPFFSKKQYTSSQKNHGIAKRWSERVIMLFITGIIFSVVFELGRIGTVYILPEEYFSLKNTIAVFFVALILHHYYLDAVIWKFGKDKELSKGIQD